MSDYLSDEEQVERLKSWWSENGTFLLASVLVAVLGIAGWNYYGSYRNDTGERSSAVLRQYLDSDPGQREDFVAAISQEHSGSAAHVLVLFDQAENNFSNGEIFEAEKLLEEALEVRLRKGPEGPPLGLPCAHCRLHLASQERQVRDVEDGVFWSV